MPHQTSLLDCKFMQITNHKVMFVDGIHFFLLRCYAMDDDLMHAIMFDIRKKCINNTHTIDGRKMVDC